MSIATGISGFGRIGRLVLRASVEYPDIDIKAINSKVFPGLQGGPLMHVIAAKAICFKEAMSPEFKAYQQQIVKNAAALAAALADYRIKALLKAYDIIGVELKHVLIKLDLVDNAKAKAKDIGAIASQDVKREANEIEQLLKDVDAISRKFNSSLEQLHKDVYALGNKLNNSASSLLNLHTDLTGIEAHSVNFDMDVPDDAIRVERTNDGSGLTFISYEPNTEFNADLNIQPNSIIDED